MEARPWVYGAAANTREVYRISILEIKYLKHRRVSFIKNLFGLLVLDSYELKRTRPNTEIFIWR